MPHPYLVPVSPTFSLIAHSSGVSSSTSTSIVLPLIVRLAIAVPFVSPIHQLNPDAMLDTTMELFKSRKCVCEDGRKPNCRCLARACDFNMSVMYYIMEL